MLETDDFTLPKSGKQSWFDNHRKFLPMNHPWSRNKKNLSKNKVVDASPPNIKTGQEVLAKIERWGLKRVTNWELKKL